MTRSSLTALAAIATPAHPTAPTTVPQHKQSAYAIPSVKGIYFTQLLQGFYRFKVINKVFIPYYKYF
ncbi:hypothetical protein [Sulfolobus acidocaldarius]|uniref:hypothetical protein n=1 Tax=Sulfolobus acidocaldarius TaxID=2285 RepID=UPI000B1C0705|nr:hypothetical protein [Sulfolobus acidocaldarius]WCM34661.1 hypothetical protein GO597_04595 [Sulfolobus acidocaldarius DSM 639]